MWNCLAKGVCADYMFSMFSNWRFTAGLNFDLLRKPWNNIACRCECFAFLLAIRLWYCMKINCDLSIFFVGEDIFCVHYWWPLQIMKNKLLPKGFGLKKTNGPKVFKTFIFVQGSNCQIKQNRIDCAILMWTVQRLHQRVILGEMKLLDERSLRRWDVFDILELTVYRWPDFLQWMPWSNIIGRDECLFKDQKAQLNKN